MDELPPRVTYDVVAITSYQGKLYAATSDESVYARRISERDERWTRIGHAGDPVGLAFVENKLFLVTGDSHMSIRDITEREIDWDYAEPDKNVPLHMPGRWYNLRNPIAINFGVNSQSFVHSEDAIQYCVAGFAHIMLLRLRRPVPREIAIPMRVLLGTPDSNTNPSQFWSNQQLKVPKS